MGLQTSGAISLNDIHVEAGGSSGTQASINDTDIRALISKASGAQMSFSEWYGASASFQIASGNSSYTAPSQYTAESFKLGRVNGFIRSGFVTPTTFTMNGVSSQWFELVYGTSNSRYTLTLLHLQNGAVLGQPSPTSGFPSNSGWTSVVVAGNGSSRTLNRTSAVSYTTGTAGFTSGSNIILYPSATWQFSGLSNIFPTSNNTTNFTLTMTP